MFESEPFGTVFSVTTGGQEIVLHGLTGPPDAHIPRQA